MSDTLAPAPTAPAADAAPAAPVAPTAAVAPPAPAPPSAVSDGGAPPAVAQQPPETAVDARGRLHAPDGKFLPKGEGAAPEGSTAPASAAEPTTDTPSEPTADAPPADGWVKIEVPGFREMGFEAIHAKPEEERAIRALVNGYARRGEVEQAQTYVRQVEDYAVTLEAERNAYWELLQTALSDPSIGEEAAQVRELFGEEAYQRYMAGLLGQTTDKVREHETTLKQQAEVGRTHREAVAFSQKAYQAAREVFPLWGEREVNAALDQYATWLEITKKPNYDLNDFFQQANLLYIQHPQVIEEARRRQSEEQERVRKEALATREAEERRQLEEAAARRATNPWAATPSSALRTGVSLPRDGEGPASAIDARRSLRFPTRT